MSCCATVQGETSSKHQSPKNTEPEKWLEFLAIEIVTGCMSQVATGSGLCSSVCGDLICQMMLENSKHPN
jgi:hypothetical protein